MGKVHICTGLILSSCAMLLGACGETEQATQAAIAQKCQQDSSFYFSNLQLVGFSKAELARVVLKTYSSKGVLHAIDTIQADSFELARYEEGAGCNGLGFNFFKSFLLTQKLSFQIAEHPPFELENFQKTVFTGRTMTGFAYSCVLGSFKLNGQLIASPNLVLVKNPAFCAEQ
jgi:hypothetical protein